MSDQWLTIQSFQMSQNLISAINKISIHLKLRLAGVQKEADARLADAINLTYSFLKNWDLVLKQIEDHRSAAVKGLDPRLRKLTDEFLAAKRRLKKSNSFLFMKSPGYIAELLGSSEPSTQRALLNSLGELRSLLEEHVYSDMLQIMGEI